MQRLNEAKLTYNSGPFRGRHISRVTTQGLNLAFLTQTHSSEYLKGETYELVLVGGDGEASPERIPTSIGIKNLEHEPRGIHFFTGTDNAIYVAQALCGRRDVPTEITDLISGKSLKLGGDWISRFRASSGNTLVTYMGGRFIEIENSKISGKVFPGPLFRNELHGLWAINPLKKGYIAAVSSLGGVSVVKYEEEKLEAVIEGEKGQFNKEAKRRNMPVLGEIIRGVAADETSVYVRIQLGEIRVLQGNNLSTLNEVDHERNPVNYSYLIGDGEFAFGITYEGRVDTLMDGHIVAQNEGHRGRLRQNKNFVFVVDRGHIRRLKKPK